jgi:hypothetical protein
MIPRRIPLSSGLMVDPAALHYLASLKKSAHMLWKMVMLTSVKTIMLGTKKLTCFSSRALLVLDFQFVEMQLNANSMMITLEMITEMLY